jgi:hypothetical protein
MVSATDVAVVAGMAVFGLVLAGVAAVVVRQIIAEFGGPDAARYQHLALYGVPVYVVAFVVFGLSFLGVVETVAGVETLYVGLAIMLLAVVPWGVAIFGAFETGFDADGGR